MRKEYVEQLESIRSKMEKAEALAEKFPCFEDYIINMTLVEGKDSTRFGDRYKDIHLAWGINRYFYDGARRKITNFNGDYQGYLFNIHVSSFTLYNLHSSFELEESIPKDLFFFFDKLNSTFYIPDETIGKFLDALNKWYLVARIKAADTHKQIHVEKLRKELEALEK